MKAVELLFAFAALCTAQNLPEWVQQAAAMQEPVYPARVGEVVLLHEERLTVSPSGRRSMHERKAVRIVQRGGSVLAARTYDSRNARITEFRAWLVPPAGKVISYGRDHVVDVAVDRGGLYDEARRKVMRCPESTAPGSVFAYEIIEEETTLFTQGAWRFQERAPTLVSRLILSLPPGWEVQGIVFNRQGVQPDRAGNQYTWELRDLPWIEDEEYSPSLDLLAPWLGFSYFPSAARSAGLRALKDWGAVSAWASEFADPAAQVTDAIRAKAFDLTRNAATELDKIRAVAAFVQQTAYVSVATNLTRGGGYIPNSASLVLSRNYGDCKDKVTLMRALLKAVEIDSFIMAVFAGDRRAVRPEWPSSLQFNHAIAAIRVSPETSLPAVTDRTALGRLLLFDPTSRVTPVGDLPDTLQGSRALVMAGPKGELVQLPRLPVGMNRQESSSAAVINSAGRLTGRTERRHFGQSGATWRLRLLEEGLDELKRAFERILARQLGAANLERCTTPTDHPEGRFDVSLEFSASQFGQVVQERLLLLRPGALGSIPNYGFTARERKWPVELNAGLWRDIVHLKLPAGFVADEIPGPIELEKSYGAYRASWKVEQSEVIFEQSLELNDSLMPASEFANVRDFFAKVAAAQASTLVLIRK